MACIKFLCQPTMVIMLSWALGALAQAATLTTPGPAFSDLLGPCPTPTEQNTASISCGIYGPGADTHLWVPLSKSTSESLTAANFTAFTVVTIVNTVVGTSRVTTIYNEPPEGFTMPDTNSDGTRITTVTVTRLGTAVTAVVTYPTSYIVWPDYYGWAGVITVTQTVSNATFTQCVVGSPSTWDNGIDFGAYPPTPRLLTSNPQETGNLGSGDVDDPYGLNADLEVFSDPVMEWAALAGVFPGELPLQVCPGRGFESPGGPSLGSYSPYWILTATSVSYEGEDEAGAHIRATSSVTTTARRSQGEPVEGPPVTTTEAGPVEPLTVTTSHTMRGDSQEQTDTQAFGDDDQKQTRTPSPGDDFQEETHTPVSGGNGQEQTHIPSGGVLEGPRWIVLLTSVAVLLFR